MQEKQRILVADDEPEIREVLRMMLSSEGYEILEADRKSTRLNSSHRLI